MNNSLIQNKLDSLIKLYMTTGVQPSDLADNIFLDHYKKISFYKDNDLLIGELVFEEDLVGIKVDSILRYFYKEKQVILIEEEFINNKKIIWDRDEKTSNLIKEIAQLIKETYTSNEVELFITNLPIDLATKIQNHLSLSA